MIKAFENLNIEQSWVTVGSFDGVHLGHQTLARELVLHAHQQNHQAVVITFSPHPAVFFKRAPLGYSLTSQDERERLLKALGIDQIVTIEFNSEIANLSARDFMLAMKESLGITHLAVGFNFALGRGRSGDISTLQALGSELGYKVDIVPPFKINEEVISSSQIRKLLAEGQLNQANRCLGRPYSLEGNVIHGEHRGNLLGFPTANLDIAPDRLLPARGVYASRLKVDGKKFMAVTNIGVRPTFDNPLTNPRVEPYILDLHDDLYGKYLELELLEYLRPEETFATPQDLITQINLDVNKTRELFDHVQ